MELKIKKINSDAVILHYAKEDDCGLDLSSIEDYVIEKGKKVIVNTGLIMEIPKTYFGSIRDRSGLAAKNGIHVLAGVVDSGYRGEIKVVLINLGEEKFEIKKGDRIAQMIIQPYERCDIIETEKLDENSSRGSEGFGSTGIN